jgi:hypothetical protein
MRNGLAVTFFYLERLMFQRFRCVNGQQAMNFNGQAFQNEGKHTAGTDGSCRAGVPNATPK